MPKRTDLTSILIIGSGPIIIGQGCEFDYSGVQACRALREEGYRVVLVNSNPATIMTDPELADATYIEPINWHTIAKIIAKEKPNALLPTMGGQIALNCALDLVNNEVLTKYNVSLIGASTEAIDRAESREKFKFLVKGLGLQMPHSFIAHDLPTAKRIQDKLGFPVVIRTSYTLGGYGSGVAYNQQDFLALCERGLALSPISEILIEESLIGWKEFELEVMRDKNDNCIVICTIENLDAMGVHTGDSITVAPAQTLTDQEYQPMRSAAFAILRAVGVETGGANVQFAINPCTGDMRVIEVNPRVSRSSALASKVTGFPIAKVAAKLAVGYTLDELKNEIVAGVIPVSFEPTIDYVAVKLPRFNFEKFPHIKPQLTTKMQAVGEIMAIDAVFIAAIQKAIVALDLSLSGFEPQVDLRQAEILHLSASELQGQTNLPQADCITMLEQQLTVPGPLRILYIADAYRAGFTTEKIYRLTNIDCWFLAQIEQIVLIENNIATESLATITADKLMEWKHYGFTDQRLAMLCDCSTEDIRTKRQAFGIQMTFTKIDSCAAEFPATTPYLYGSYGHDYVCEAEPTDRQKVIILGSGANRIGQGIEFDYCCVHAVQALKELGFEAIMVNCNPETVSTDYDIADRLYFEAITLETVLEIVALEQPVGVIVQFGGQTPLKIAKALQAAGVNILGTSPASIEYAEDRKYFHEFVQTLQFQQAKSKIAHNVNELLSIVKQLNYPLIIRPSYVLGGNTMEIIRSKEHLIQYIEKIKLSPGSLPILLEEYLEEAIEVDVDAIVDVHGEVFVAGIMEHIEFAGIHSGDSACVLPPHYLTQQIQHELARQISVMAKELNVVGLVNAQFAIKNDVIYVLEINPRASRTIPFVSKAIGLPLCKLAVACIMGNSLSAQNIAQNCNNKLFSVKYPIFSVLSNTNTNVPELLLGPEMKSTGEVMGVATSFAQAYAKCVEAAGLHSSKFGHNINIQNNDKLAIEKYINNPQNLNFKLQELS